MRKVALILTTIAFFGCLALGIWISNQTSLTTTLPTPPPTDVPAPAELTHQTNLILIHVDDLQSARPAIRSLWGLFISLQDPVNVMFAPLLPLTSQETQARLLRSFRLNDNHSLDARFIENVRKDLKLTFSEYILIDDNGMRLAAAWMSERAVIPFEHALNQDESISEAEQAFFSSACDFFSASSTGGPLFAWNKFFPDYAYTNLSFQNAIRIWATLTEPQNSTRCEVFYPDRTN